MAEATNTAPTGLEQVSVADGDWAYERAKDIRQKWMQAAFMKGGDFALPAGHLSDMAEALRHAHATGYTIGHEAGDKYRSGKLVASTGSGKEETKGACLTAPGSCPSGPTASRSSGFAAAIPSRGWQPIATAPTEGEFLVGLHVRRHDPVTREVVDEWEEIHVIAVDDETGEIADGYEHGWQLSDYEFWKPIDPLPSVRDRSSEAAETLGSAGGKSPADLSATPEATPKSSPSQTPVDPQMTVEEAKEVLGRVGPLSSPGQRAKRLRDVASKVNGTRARRLLARASRIEAALRTLQSAGEVR